MTLCVWEGYLVMMQDANNFDFSLFPKIYFGGHSRKQKFG